MHAHVQMDIRWVNWADPHTLTPLHDFCEFRHLLHLAGCSWSSRLKYLMLCRATIVFPKSPYLEFWYRALTPGKNVLVTPEMVRPEAATHLVDVARRLQKDEALAQRCGSLLHLLCSKHALVAAAANVLPLNICICWLRMYGQSTVHIAAKQRHK